MIAGAATELTPTRNFQYFNGIPGATAQAGALIEMSHDLKREFRETAQLVGEGPRSDDAEGKDRRDWRCGDNCRRRRMELR